MAEWWLDERITGHRDAGGAGAQTNLRPTR
jgi:hypothetical protein